MHLAAWFHDIGHLIKYKGHERESQKLAWNWLQRESYPSDKMKIILSCIAATQLPQTPKNLLEQVICDADLFHLSLEEYLSFAVSTA